MSKLCPISNCHTNCTDNCAACLAEEKRYVVKAYLCTNFAGLMDNLETDDFNEVEEFIWANCQKGYNCEFVDNEDVNNCGIAYADLFTEDTVEAEELIVHEHGTAFYNDLLMEQQEQM